MNKKNKYNYIVSNFSEIWVKGCKNLCIIEPYIYLKLKENNQINNYHDIKVVPYIRKNRNDLHENCKYVLNKYNFYLDILYERLNSINGKSYKKRFWQKIFGIYLIRHITLLYEVFQYCEKYFNPDIFEFNILSEDSFYIPLDNEEFLKYFKNSDIGQEQLFSIYIKLFYPEYIKDNEYYLNANFIKTDKNQKERKKNCHKIIKNLLCKFNLKKIIKFILRHNSPTVAVIGSYFQEKYMNQLLFRSLGKIQIIDWQKFKVDNDDKQADQDRRNEISVLYNDFDKFDRYFFYSLKFCLPLIYIENFKNHERHISSILANYKKIKYVTSEAWISNTYQSFALALMQKKGIKHINNEHNFISHIVMDSDIPLIAKLSDIFITIGWYDSNIPNVMKGSSLYQWGLQKKLNKEYKISYIASAVPVKYQQYKSVFQTAAENSERYYKFILDFFKNLDKNTLLEIFYRGYPSHLYDNWIEYNSKYIIRHYKFGEMDNHLQSSKTIMRKSRLVIIDYISTSYIEALYMNIPTIFFWNKYTYFLDYKYHTFFDGLISAGICQTDPVKAARFVEEIKDNPEEWWNQKDVQEVKNTFLKRNIGDPNVMLNFLLNLAKNPNKEIIKEKSDVTS